MRFLLWLVLVFGTVSAEAAPWVKVELVRQPRTGGVYGDIASRARVNWTSDGLSTMAHEDTHEINSNVRNRPEYRGGKYNAVYVLNGYAAVLQEPKSTLKHILTWVPTSIRGPGYHFLSTVPIQDWNNEPLYLMDEWSAYLNGAVVALDTRYYNAGKISRAVGYMNYCLVLQYVVPEDPDLRIVIKYQAERTRILCEKWKKTHPASFQRASLLFSGLRGSQDTEDLRQYLIKTYGQKWCGRVLGFTK